MIVESGEDDLSVIDEVIGILKKHSDFEFLSLKHEPMVSLPGLEIDTAHRKVYCEGQEITLTAKEYDLLCLFAANEGNVLTYDQIYRAVWKEEAFGNANNAIACHVHNLREKIGRNLKDGCFSIRCIREVGYCFKVDLKYAANT